MDDKIYSIEEIKALLNEHKEYLSKKYNVGNFLLFGSYAKNKQTPQSDIDLLVNFIKPIDMFDFIDLQDYLSGIFKKKIDLGTPNSLKSFIKNVILREAIEL
ncbi:nucleotidyltransferase family protein [bacterium]|nr:nucleotidyltransferase family protein [bacterium]